MRTNKLTDRHKKLKVAFLNCPNALKEQLEEVQGHTYLNTFCYVHCSFYYSCF